MNLLRLILQVSWIFVSLFQIKGDDSCNHVKFSAELYVNKYFQDTIGTFSLSTNRCQSFRGLVDYYVDTTMIHGSMKFTCPKNSNNKQNTVNMTYYKDSKCSDVNGEISLRHNETLNFDGYVIVSMQDVVCNNLDCHVGYSFGKNCSWEDSELYLNASLPYDDCLSLGNDFKGILDDIPDQILPKGVANRLDKRSYKYSCCTSDHSLLVYNYSDTTCQNSKLFNEYRISTDYNGTCFTIDGDYGVFGSGNENNDSNSNSDDNYKFVLEWVCGTYTDCDGVEFIDGMFISSFFSFFVCVFIYVFMFLCFICHQCLSFVFFLCKRSLTL